MENEKLKIDIPSKADIKTTGKVNASTKMDLKTSVTQRIPEDLKTDTFIAIIGQPVPNADDDGPKPMIVNAEDNPALIKPPDKDPVDSSPGFHERKVMDVLDANNEDPFTLDSFKDLVLAHADEGKDYIIARVITMDPKDNNRFYYSYYPGHNINKVLFRTQPEEGLLHRMKAKNPLNNMTIVGDVFYYSITCSDVSRIRKIVASNQSSPESVNRRHPLGQKLKKLLQQSPKSSYLVTRPDVHNNAPLKTRRPSADDVFSYTKTAPAQNGSPSKLFNNSSFWQGWQDALRSLPNDDTPHSAQTATQINGQILSPKQTSYLNDHDSVTINDWISVHCISKEKSPQIFYAHYIGGDDDFLMKSNFRQYFKRNALTEEEAVLFSLPTNSLYQGPPDIANQLPPNDDQSRLKMVRYVLGSYLMVIILVLCAFLVSSKNQDSNSEQFRTMIIVSGVLLSIVVSILIAYEIYIRRNSTQAEQVPLTNEDHEE